MDAVEGAVHQHSLVEIIPTKKPKRSQVKNACSSCQRACKKCDVGRPCMRCIKFHMESTCVDSVRKERSRARRGNKNATNNTLEKDHFQSGKELSDSNKNKSAKSIYPKSDVNLKSGINNNGILFYRPNDYYPEWAPISSEVASAAAAAEICDNTYPEQHIYPLEDSYNQGVEQQQNLVWDNPLFCNMDNHQRPATDLMFLKNVIENSRSERPAAAYNAFPTPKGASHSDSPGPCIIQKQICPQQLCPMVPMRPKKQFMPLECLLLPTQMKSSADQLQKIHQDEQVAQNITNIPQPVFFSYNLKVQGHQVAQQDYVNPELCVTLNASASPPGHSRKYLKQINNQALCEDLMSLKCDRIGDRGQIMPYAPHQFDPHLTTHIYSCQGIENSAQNPQVMCDPELADIYDPSPPLYNQSI